MKVQKRDRKLFGYGTVIGFVALSIALASVPKTGGVSDDTALYQQLSEIRVQKESAPNFDSDIKKLSAVQPKYRERPPLPSNRSQSALDRVSRQRYIYSGSH